MEEYRDIPGYEGLYQVSNFGNVKSLERYYLCRNKHKALMKERILKTRKGNDGYLYLSLSNDRKIKTIKVHQLVAMTFLGYIPNGNTLVINHKDFDKLNNKLENLEIITNRENVINSRLKPNKTGYIGVYDSRRKKNPYKVTIQHLGKQIALGSFTNVIDAAKAYDKGAMKYHGRFAKSNFKT